MKGLRISVERDGRRVTEVRVEPPTSVTVGCDPSCTVIIPEVATATLFDYFGAQYRLFPISGMSGSLSFSGYNGPFEPLDAWRTRAGTTPPIGLRDRACGELHFRSWRFRFLHAPISAALEPSGPAPALTVSEIGDGIWVCHRCYKKNGRSLMFCLGCGEDVGTASPTENRWLPQAFGR